MSISEGDKGEDLTSPGKKEKDRMKINKEQRILFFFIFSRQTEYRIGEKIK